MKENKTQKTIKNKFIQIRVTEEEYLMFKSVSQSQNKSITEIIKAHFIKLYKK